jgi:sterol desaturase/sphingolipid hydroxylase (fatty acid hydroxylase superfamily)
LETIEVTSTHEIHFLVLVGGMIGVMLLETLIPRRPESRNLMYRWTNNLSLTMLDFFVAAWAGGAIAVLLSRWSADSGFGLLQRIDAGWIVSFLVVLLLAEFLSYLVHRAFHVVPTLWRIHAVHHTDVEMDVTTSHRHHPLELLLPLPLTAPVFLFLGPPATAALAYVVLRTGVGLLSHGNICLPQAVDRVLRLFVVTPDFHRLHHSSDRRFTDSNYGVVLPWFDYLFRTATDLPFHQQKTMELGLEYLREPRDSRLDQMLLLPFRRSTWRRFMPVRPA